MLLMITSGAVPLFSAATQMLISPGETFASIARQPDFLAPLVVILVLAAVGGFIFAQRVDFTAPAREAMEQKGNVSDAQMESALRITAIVSKVIAYGSPLFSVMAPGAVVLVDERDLDRARELYASFFGEDTSPLTGPASEEDEAEE